MPFKLEVDFSGLCLHVVDPDTGHVAVLMPDCRRRTHGPAPFHADETEAAFHVGYVRINLADLGVPLTPPAATNDKAEEPRYELVHRFDRQLLQFVGEAGAGAVTRTGLEIPDFARFAPEVELIDGLFTEVPPAELLMRCILEGGTLEAKTLSINPPTWTFSTQLNPNAEPYKGQFASFATWTREFYGNTLTLRITDFAGSPEAEFTLGPVPDGGTLRLDVANLCAENPLEWSDMETRTILGDDKDFKWLYRLLKPHAGSFQELVNKNEPFPIPGRPGVAGETRDDDCISGTVTARFSAPQPAPGQ